MRIEGTIKTWNDERAFGFIEPTQGGQDIFVHVKAFRVRSGRPRPGQRVTFEIELNPEGKKRARDVEPYRPVRVGMRRRKNSPAQWGTASYFAIPAFLALYVLIGVLWRIPAWVNWLYTVASVLAFAVYANDKSAAVAGRWRVREKTLLLLGLVGGWPGAIVAQQVFRHKSNKAAFRANFWNSVLVNVVAFVLLASPPMQQLFRA
jgi:uncharacterized membrane protein YsdA (DUF1294 family)/cold shock CspA family protein